MDDETIKIIAELAMEQKIKVQPIPDPLGKTITPILAIPSEDFNKKFLKACADYQAENC